MKGEKSPEAKDIRIFMSLRGGRCPRRPRSVPFSKDIGTMWQAISMLLRDCFGGSASPCNDKYADDGHGDGIKDEG